MKLKNTRKGGNALGPVLSSFVFALVFIFTSFSAKGQLSPAAQSSIPAFPFIHLEADSLINVNLLAPFFSKLRQLRNGDSIQVNIVNIGDSHIQADFLTREVRKNFQIEFGNAGRGLIFPLRLARTNEPSDFKSTSPTIWNSANIRSPVKFSDPGIAGVSIQTNENGAYFDVVTYDHDELNYAFDRITLIHTKDSLQYDCRISDSLLQESYLMSAAPVETNDCITRVSFDRPTNHVRIQTEQCNEQQMESNINGIVLEKNNPGILYHGIGINGAQYSDFNVSPLFFRQLQLLKPDLVILSLGTNEGSTMKANEEEMIASVTGMIETLKAAIPGACFLIATPTDSYYRKKYKNPSLKIVCQALLKSATKLDVACWDMYNVTGGYGSCTGWRKQKMLRPDGVHFTKEGYTLQGALLYKALIDSYKKYAAD